LNSISSKSSRTSFKNSPTINVDGPPPIPDTPLPFDWLFDKVIVGGLLEKAGYSISMLNINSEHSLSVGYLSQTIIASQTALRYRNPYSANYDRLDDDIHLDPNNLNAPRPIGPYHKRGSSNIMGNDFAYLNPYSMANPDLTPRRSIALESIGDDNTSYDSMSQASNLDRNDQQQMYYNGDGFDGPSDFTTFETIKRCLFNSTFILFFFFFLNCGNNIFIYFFKDNDNNGADSSVVNSRYSNQMNMNSNKRDSNYQDEDEQLLQSQQEQQQLDDSLRIINDFKKKPFDELKQTIQRQNLNADKYQQVHSFNKLKTLKIFLIFLLTKSLLFKGF
jgi:hypothetical protein